MGFVGGVWTEYTTPMNASNITAIIQYDNEITNNLFGVGILMGFFILMFVLTGREPKLSIPISLYGTTLVGIFMAATTPPLVGVDIVATLIILDVISTIILYAGGNS